jgi:hypothetical protein
VEIVIQSDIFVFMPYHTGMVTVYVAVLQDCLLLLTWFMNIGQFPLLLYASRIFPDKNMQYTVERNILVVLWQNSLPSVGNYVKGILHKSVLQG